MIKNAKISKWTKLALSAPVVATLPALISSCSIIQNLLSPSEEAAKKQGFGLWDDKTLDLSSKDFWNNPDVKKAVGGQFNLWQEMINEGRDLSKTLRTEVTFLDLGQADGTLIKVYPSTIGKQEERNNNSFNILIDSGDFKAGTFEDKGVTKIHTPFYETKLKPTLNQLLDNGNDKIDLFMFSHAHGDHIGQADKAINDFSKKGQSIVINWGDIKQNSSGFKKLLGATIKNELIYLDPFVENAIDINRLVPPKEETNVSAHAKAPNTDDPFYQFVDPKVDKNNLYGKADNASDLNTWKANGAKLFKMSPLQNIVTFAVDNFFAYLAPQKDYEPNQPNKSPNENSINAMLKLNNGKKAYRIIFTGDAEGHTHDDMLEAINQNPKFQDQYATTDADKIAVDMYKVAHHGSTTEQSNNEAFLTTITKANTKFIVQANDNRLFSGSPTLKTKFFENLDTARYAKKLGNSLDESVFISQNLGDIEFIFTNHEDNLEYNVGWITTIDRVEQKKLGRIKLKNGQQMSNNPASLYKPAKDPTQFEHYIKKPQKKMTM